MNDIDDVDSGTVSEYDEALYKLVTLENLCEEHDIDLFVDMLNKKKK